MNHQHSRRDFLEAVVVGGSAALLGCGGSTPGNDASSGGRDAASGTDANAPGVCAAVTATIALNHGHVLAVPLADVTAAVDMTYDIMGTSLHTHSVTITGTQFATIASSGTVTLTSGTGGMHTHSITVVCGP